MAVENRKKAAQSRLDGAPLPHVYIDTITVCTEQKVRGLMTLHERHNRYNQYSIIAGYIQLKLHMPKNKRKTAVGQSTVNEMCFEENCKLCSRIS